MGHTGRAGSVEFGRLRKAAVGPGPRVVAPRGSRTPRSRCGCSRLRLDACSYAAILGPAGAWWRRPRRRRPRASHRHACSRAVVSGDRIRLELVDDAGNRAGARIRSRHRGHRITESTSPCVPFLSRPAPAVRTVDGTGSPLLTPGFESSVPGLYFTGLASAMTFGPLMRFVHGVHFAAPRVARAAAFSVSRPG